MRSYMSEHYNKSPIGINGVDRMIKTNSTLFLSIFFYLSLSLSASKNKQFSHCGWCSKHKSQRICVTQLIKISGFVYKNSGGGTKAKKRALPLPEAFPIVRLVDFDKFVCRNFNIALTALYCCRTHNGCVYPETHRKSKKKSKIQPREGRKKKSKQKIHSRLKYLIAKRA